MSEESVLEQQLTVQHALVGEVSIYLGQNTHVTGDVLGVFGHSLLLDSG